MDHKVRINQIIKLIGFFLAGLLLLLVVLLVLAGNFLYHFALNPHNPNGFGAAAGLADTEDTRWLLAESKPVTLTSRDGLTLSAYQIPNDAGHKYAVVCHGYQSNAVNTATYGRRFYDLGYSVLLPDARGHGSSEGDYIGMGWPERLDLLDWVGAIIASDPQAEIVLFGISMGGATVMMASGETLPQNVKCIIEDCGYTSAWDEFAFQLKALYKLPPFPVLHAASLVTKVRAGYFFGEASAAAQVAKSTTPTLFIHGEADDFVPFWMLDVVYDAATCEKEKLVVPGAAHAQSSTVAPELYWSTVETFLSRYLT